MMLAVVQCVEFDSHPQVDAEWPLDVVHTRPHRLCDKMQQCGGWMDPCDTGNPSQACDVQEESADLLAG